MPSRLAPGLCAVLLLAASTPVLAIMAGAPPDSPAVRVDPNTPDSPWAGVGSLLVDGGVYSAVVIGPRHVLTAAHVAGNASHTRFQLNAGESPLVVQAQSVHRHHGFARYDPKQPRDDLAVIVLRDPLPAGTPVYALHRAGIATANPTPIVMVGYGASGNGDSGPTVSPAANVKRVGRNQIDVVATDGQGLQRVFLFDFDGAGAPNLLGGPSLGNAVEATFAGGDSGGPSFVCEGGQGDGCVGGRWALLGINTFIMNPGDPAPPPSTFGTLGGGMLLPAYADWIDEVLLQTGGAPRAP